MKIKSLFLLLALCCATWVSSQTLMFEKIYADSISSEAMSIQPDGTGYIMAGTVQVNGVLCVALIKLDSLGNIVWSNRYTTSASVFGLDVKPVSTGGYIVALQKTITSSTYDVGAIRISSTGTVISQVTWSGNGSEEIYEVAETSDGGFLFSGRSDSYGDMGAMLIKTDAALNLQWRRVYHGNRGSEGCSAKEVPSGGYVLTSRLFDSITAGFVGHTMVVRVDINGDTLWTTTFGGITNSDEAEDIEVLPDGSFVVAGRTNSNASGLTDIFLAKLDSSGTLLWSKVYGGLSVELTYDIDITHDGGVIVGGWTESFGSGVDDYYLIRTDANGDTLWTAVTGTPGGDFLYSIHETADKGFIMTGSSYPTPSSDYVMYVVKTDSTGTTGCGRKGSPTIVNPALFQESHLPVHYYSGNSTAPSGYAVLPITLGITTYCSNVSVPEADHPSFTISIFPDPASDAVTIETDVQFAEASVLILNSLGQIVYTMQTSNTGVSRIDVSHLAEGIYTLQLITDAQESSYAKFMIVR